MNKTYLKFQNPPIVHNRRNKSQPGHTTTHPDRLVGSIVAMTTETFQQVRFAAEYRRVQAVDVRVYEDADVPIEE